MITHTLLGLGETYIDEFESVERKKEAREREREEGDREERGRTKREREEEASLEGERRGREQQEREIVSQPPWAFPVQQYYSGQSYGGTRPWPSPQNFDPPPGSYYPAGEPYCQGYAPTRPYPPPQNFESSSLTYDYPFSLYQHPTPNSGGFSGTRPWQADESNFKRRRES
jgi:hypothetical protein